MKTVTNLPSRPLGGTEVAALCEDGRLSVAPYGGRASAVTATG